MANDITLPQYLFSRDWYAYSAEEIQLILQAMRGTTRLSHEEHYRPTLGPKKPPAADRTLLLAVSADAIVHLWQEIDRLTRDVTVLTGALRTLTPGTPSTHDDQPGDADDTGEPESLRGPQ